MDLLEYQAKELFKQVGIPVLPSQSLSSPSQLKNLRIPYPVVLKSQVVASGRAKVGGVKFVSNTIDAIAASQSIFNLPIEKEYPKVILAETRYDAQNEVFLAIMLDYHLKKPVLLGSSQGGIHIEELLDSLTHCTIEDDYSPFYGRHLAKQMGLQGNMITSVSTIIDKMYQLFQELDLDIIEINPLGISGDGAVMALDGKIRVNNYGLFRHPELLELIKPIDSSLTPDKELLKSQLFSSFTINPQGSLAVICHSVDEAIFTINQIKNNREKIVIHSCIIMGKKLDQVTAENLNALFESILSNQNIATVLVNMPLENEFNQRFIETIKKYYPADFSHWSNKNEERGDRPTGKRFQVNQSPSSKSSFPLRKIDWIIRTTEIIPQDKTEKLPITLVNRLQEKFAV
jgi:succinyl-CoA synthetase beta subunit